MKSESERIVTQASDEMLARWLLKNLGGYDPEAAEAPGDAEFLTEILSEHRRQINAARPEERALLSAYAEAVKLAATPEIRRYTTDEMERRHIYLIVRDEEEGCEGEGTHIREWRLGMNIGPEKHG